MRKKIIAGNWKMNLSSSEADELFKAIDDPHYDNNEVIKIIFPPHIYIDRFIKKRKEFKIGAQNLSSYNNGAYTGEISGSMLHSIGCEYVLIGHSERRLYFDETESILSLKVKQALENKLKIIFCIGETKQERESNQFINKLQLQLNQLSKSLSPKDYENIVIAYEPIWAIGTGLTATPNQVEEVHAHIRKKLEDLTDSKTAGNVSLLYGGSCNPSNAKTLFECPNVDGGLIGGASLNAVDFSSIIKTLQSTHK